MIGRARERADAVGAEAASREFQIPQLALSVKDLPLTGPVAHPPFGTALAVTPAGSWMPSCCSSDFMLCAVKGACVVWSPVPSRPTIRP